MQQSIGCTIEVFYYFFCVCVTILYGCLAFIYVCAPCACLVPTEAKRGPKIPLEVDLEMVVNCHLSAEN